MGDVHQVPTTDVNDPGIEAKVAFLKDVHAYPEHPAQVDVIETHMSWVFLVDRHVYKLKKPVQLERLDLRTPQARRANCETELRVNRRLAPDVYLGVVTLTLDEGGLRLGGTGTPVDWLVKMRRLPAHLMLDEAIRTGHANADNVAPAAALLSHFYTAAAPVLIDDREYVARVEQRISEDRAELTGSLLGLPFDLPPAPLLRQREFVRGRGAELLGQRAVDGWIVEGHGDLRPEHVYLGDPPVAIDCLEFDRDLRISDPLDELAFLAMECERLGAPWVGPVLFDVYERETGDVATPALVHFYASSRACRRARLAMWHLHDPTVTDRAKWPRVATEYLRLAANHADELLPSDLEELHQ